MEDDGFLRGTTRFLRDLPVEEGCLHAAFVRSTVAHGRLLAVDVAAARRRPGVVAVLTARDLDLSPFRPFAAVPERFGRPPLAIDRVRFVGEPVALVVADTAAHAVDAVEEVLVDVDPLPAVVGADAALAPDAPRLFPAADPTAMQLDMQLEMPAGTGRPTTTWSSTTTAAASPTSSTPPPWWWRAASRTNGWPRPRSKPNACVVRPAGDRLDVWTTCQGVQVARHELAEALGLEEADVRVRAAAVGGGFGGRHSIPVELVVVAAAARHLGRPLRWEETRTENLLTMVHGRAQCHELAMGFDDDGRIVGLRVRNLADCGAYPHFGPVMPFISRKLACGPYRIPRVDYEWLAYATTTNPIGPYRGAGQPEVTNGLERIMDLAAARLGLDPVELRRRNLLAADELPHTTPTGLTYDSGDYPRALARACELVDYDGVRAEQADAAGRGRAPRASASAWPATSPPPTVAPSSARSTSTPPTAG